MPPELLERLFVGRDAILDAVMHRIRAATTSAERNHTLLVGPRGAGKTHIVALAHHRTKALTEEGLDVQTAWLPEDPWTIASYDHLLTAIVEHLDPPVDGDIPREAGELERLLASRAEHEGPIVVFVENLDQILATIGDDGQQQFRHLLQDGRSLLIVATTTGVTRDLSDQARPFYAFFTTTRLDPFTVDEAADMLARIADEQGDEAIGDYVNDESGKARLRTIEHLAGGQPRIWATLASALTVEGLDQLVDLLLTRFDDLTPYYQEQLGRLSPQQRRVVAELAEADRPVNVGDLATRVGVDQRSLAKTMSELTDRGWAKPTTSPLTKMLDQRRTYYELAEPLARLSFQVKAARGEPIRLVIDFLKMWFDPKDLRKPPSDGLLELYLLQTIAGHEQDAVVTVARRLQRLPATRAPALALLGQLDDALAALADGDPEPLLGMPTSVRVAVEHRLTDGFADPRAVFDLRLELHRAAAEESGMAPHRAIHEWIARAEHCIASAPHDEGRLQGQLTLFEWLRRSGDFDAASALLAEITSVLGSDHPHILTTRHNLALACWSTGRIQEATDLAQQTLADAERTLGPDHPDTLTARTTLAVAYWSAGRTQEAIDLQQQALADAERILGPDHPDTLTTRNNLAVAYWLAGRTQETIDLQQQALADAERILGSDHPATSATREMLEQWQAERPD